VFRKILIANRGEIALRVLRACRELGIATVAVCSTTDRDALHARLADERVCIGPERPEDSYLNVPAVLSAALSRGADAVHPGYGLLAESGDFAEACERSGLVFVGPRVRHLRLMGDKPRARRIVEKAGVRVLPGTPAPLADLADARAVAETIGYPLLVKAAAGGGGRGLGVARDPDTLAAAFTVARREGERLFGNNLVYVERYLEQARHIEVQIVADRHRHVVQLGERDCSVQRRHQKTIAEAPAVGIDDRLRAKLAAAALEAATAVGYTNVGSVEFLVDAGADFYFIEMNTRIQVEHAVAEAVTGIDLVQAGIRAAAGEPLGFDQTRVTVRGHAIECRVHADAAAASRWQSVGAFHAPGGLGIRVESALAAGTAVDVGDEPLLMKVLAHGVDRAEAIARLRAALAEVVIDGIATDLAVQRRIVAHPDFGRGAVPTTWLEGSGAHADR
jgi:acetyl-CoA carboxylase biotin carboxylase subunit